MIKTAFFLENSEKPEITSSKEILIDREKSLYYEHERLVEHLWKMDASMLNSEDVQEKDNWAGIRLKLSKTIEDIEKKLSAFKERIIQSSDNLEHSSKNNGSFKS